MASIFLPFRTICLFASRSDLNYVGQYQRENVWLPEIGPGHDQEVGYG